MATVRIRNVNPLGMVDCNLLGREDAPFDVEGAGCLKPGEIVEVDADIAGKAPSWREPTDSDDVATMHVNGAGQVLDLGYGLLSQVGNFELVDGPPPATPAATPTSATADAVVVSDDEKAV